MKLGLDGDSAVEVGGFLDDSMEVDGVFVADVF